MKKFLRRLHREERGNVLYMTIILMMLLSVFSLALTNIVYIGVMKIRAQNAADNIALSAATLKARVLNTLTNANGAIYAFGLQMGTISELRGYTDWPTYVGAGMVMGTAIGNLVYQIITFDKHIHQERWINQIAEAHGITGESGRIEMFPVSWEHLTAGLVYDFRIVPVATGAGLALFSIQPNHTWYVQSRVEMKTKDYIIGGKHLGFELPDITARARAEVLSESLAGFLPGGKYFKASLKPVNESVDRYMREKTGSRNSGDGADREIAPVTSVTPVPTQDISMYESEEAFVDTLPMNLQYEYYREKVRKKKATVSEKIKYYNLKEKVTGHLTKFERMDRNYCYHLQNRKSDLD